MQLRLLTTLGLISMLLWASLIGTASAQTIRYVREGFTGTGTSWANASGNLQSAINASASGDQVWVAGGAYYPGTSRNASFSLKSGVAVYGGFNSTNPENSIASRVSVNPVLGTPSSTTLSGDIGTRGVATDNSYTILNNDNIASTARLDGFVISGAYNANNNFSSISGAGVVNSQGGPTFMNCQISQNTITPNASAAGAGMTNLQSNPTLLNCVVSGNLANGTLGGGLYNNFSNPTITNCVITSNTATSGGGGMYNVSAAPILTNCLLTQNVGNSRGGGSYDDRSRPRYVNCSFAGNRASSGAAIENAGTPSLANCIVWDNQGSAAFGGSTVTANYCLIEAAEPDYSGTGNIQATTSPFATTGYQLYGCSQALNAGNNSAYSSINGPSTDLAGNPRYYQGGIIDIGAYEYQANPATPPAVSITPSTTAVCQGQVATLTAQGANEYQWSTGASTPTISVSVTSTYSVTGLVTSTGCSATASAQLTVNPLPTQYIVTGGGNVCTGETGADVRLSGSQSGVNYQLLRDDSPIGSPVVGTGTAIDFGNLTQAGTYTVQARVSNTGCQQSMNGSATITTVQSIAITQQPPASSVQPAGSTVSVQVSVSGDNPAYQWYKDNLNSPVTGQTSATLTIANLQTSNAGSYSIIIRNTCNSVTSTAFNLSVNPPVTPRPSLTMPINGATTSGQPTFVGTAPASSKVTIQVLDTGNDTVRVLTTIASSPASSTTGSFSVQLLQALPSGIYTAFAQAQLPGQALGSSPQVSFTVDNTAPEVTLRASVNDGAATTNQPTSFTATFSEAVTGFSSGGISVGNGSVSGFAGTGTTYSFNVSANAAGQVSVSIPANVAADGVGNPNTASASYSYTFQAPTITLSPPPGSLPGGTQGIAYSVTFSASGGSGTYTYALSGTPPPGMTLTDARLSGTPTASGSFRFRITATDNAAAPGPHSGSGEYTINIAPQPMTGMPSLSSPASGVVTNNNRPTYSGTAPANSQVSVFVNGNNVGTTTATGGSFSLQQPAALADGAYQVYVTAQLSGQSPSNASNVSSFTVDTAAPIVTLSSAQVSNGGTTASSPVTFTAQFSEPVSGFSTSGISVSNGTASNLQAQPGGTSYSFQVTPANSGPVSVVVNSGAAQDAATNGNTASASYGFTLIPGEFAIRSVDTRQCQLVDASRGEYRVSFTPVYSGLNDSPVSLRVINEVDATTAPGPYTIRLYSDNPTVTLLAQQPASPDARFSYAWLAACQGSVAPNRPPTTTGIPAQQLVQNQPYQLELTRYFADPDGQALTYSSSALPAGLTLAGTTISGSPTAPGRTTVRIAALDPGGLSVATDVTMQVDAPPTTTPPAGFTITGVTDLTCVAITATERRVSFSPVYSGLTGSSVRFRVVNEQDFGTAPGPYSVRLYTDNPAITLEAVQAGQTATYRYDWLNACGSQSPPTITNRPPEVVVPIAPQSATVGQGYSFYVPANTFTDPEGEPLSLGTGSLPAGLSFSSSLSAITGTPAQAGTSTIELTASDPAGQSVSLSFTLRVVDPATTPPTPPAGFTITGVGSVTCLSVSSTERRLSFFPQYTGVDGSPIRFAVVNEQDFGTAPGPYSLRLYTDNPAITLTATQGGSAASYRYNWLAACATPANGRQAVAEAASRLSVIVLGNPVVGESVEVLIGGAEGQAVELSLNDLAGNRLHQQSIAKASGSERVVVPVSSGQAITVLKVSTARQQQSVKLIRQ